MNIYEAAKSGKPFKRPGKEYWELSHPEWTFVLDLVDVVADDWEVYIEPEQKIELSWEAIYAAMMKNCTSGDPFFESIKKDLGFKE